METEKFEQWMIIEMFGHIRLAGKATEANILGGHALLRLDIPSKDGKFTTQFIGPSAIFRMTPTTEEIARKVAEQSDPEPIHRWEFPQLQNGPQGVESSDMLPDQEDFDLDDGEVF